MYIHGIQWSWVQIPLRPTFYGYFKESFSGDYYMYQVIPLQSCDYLYKVSIKINVATDEKIAKMKSDTEQTDEIGVAVQSWP